MAKWESARIVDEQPRWMSAPVVDDAATAVAPTPSDKPWLDGWDEVRASMQANERAARDMVITV